MVGAGHDEQLGPHARQGKPLRVLHIFFAKKIDRADTDKGGRKPAQDFHSGRNRTRWHRWRSRWNPQQRAPAKSICRFGPNEMTDMGRGAMGAAGSVVKHWVYQALK